MPTNSDPKTLKLKKGDIICKVKGQKSAVCWKDENKLYLLTNMHNPSPSGHFVEEKEENVPKPPCTESYNNSMGFDDLSDMKVNSYSISCEMQK